MLHQICDDPALAGGVDDMVRAAVARLAGHVTDASDPLLCTAVHIAIEQHRGQFRDSGECYASHPIEVAAILAQWGFDGTTLAAACCHDVLEDCTSTADDLAARLGDDVVRIIDGVSKVPHLDLDSAGIESASLAKFLAAAAHDARVLAVKIADRLHNLRTAGHLAEHRRIRLATEALDIYAPLAHRLGLEGLRYEIEDLAFTVMHPQAAAVIDAELAALDHVAVRDRVAANVAALLHDAGIEASVEARAKHRYSIFQKMQRGTPLSAMHDLVGVRAVVDTTEACYQVLGVLHARYTPVPGRFKDFIALPRPSGYQSLHTTVLVDGLEVELQVRTRAMHLQARFGAAAHYVYKQPGVRRAHTDADLLDALVTASTPEVFLEHLREDLAPRHEVVVLTPRGKPVTLPAGATVLDFAYKIHTDIGHRCTGARVNGRITPIRTTLTTGDTVEVLLGTTPNPHHDWLAFTRTARARDKIRRFLTEQPADPEATGRDALVTALRARGVDDTGIDDAMLHRLARRNGFTDASTLCVALGSRQRTVGSLTGLPAVQTTPRRKSAPAPELHTALDAALGGVPWGFPRCCALTDPDAAVAIVSRNRRFVVHDRTCASLAATVHQLALGELARITVVGHDVAPQWVEVHATDRLGLLRDLSDTFTRLSADITMSRTETDDGMVIARFTITAAPAPAAVRAAVEAVPSVVSVVLR
jgi:GTP pyrophosphokinase